jgi:hypothetical protein
MSSNIEEMEKYKSLYCRDYPKADIWVASFMGHCIDSLKDLHEENTRLWKAIAELQIEDMQKLHDKIYENNLDNRKELNIDDKDNQKD